MPMEHEASANAVILGSGDLFVPHTAIGGAAITAQEPTAAPAERDKTIYPPLIIKND